MPSFHCRMFLVTTIIFFLDLSNRLPVTADIRFFEYELPNRTITICPSYSLISLECPQLASASDPHAWQPNLPKYLISIDYIRSFPLRLGFDPRSCQPDLTHACNNYDLRYVNTLCNGKPHCSDISAYQIRERTLCAFKAVTEIGFHCVPTWNLYDVQTKQDICGNTSLHSDYGFIHSRNYPQRTVRMSCFTTIHPRPNQKIVLYFVDGELNHDQLRIESVAANGMPVLNISFSGNLSTQRIASSMSEMRITFIPSQIYSYHPTYYLLYFYMIPLCSVTEPCWPAPPIETSTTIFLPGTTSRTRVQSVGWTRVPNMWIVIPVILAYVLLLALIVVLALLLQRRRKQQKLTEELHNTALSSRYLNASGTSSRAQLVTPLPPPISTGVLYDPRSSRRRISTSHGPHHLPPSSSFAQSPERYYRESRSDFDLHQSGGNGIDYRHHASITNRVRPATLADPYRGYGTIDHASYNRDRTHQTRPIPKSFSDCDLCKRRVIDEEHQQYVDENWRLENTGERRAEPRPYRDKIKERVRERLTVRQTPDEDVISPAPVEYSTVLPRHQRIASGALQTLPFEYIPSEPTNRLRTRSSSQEPMGTTESGTSVYTRKFYERDGNDTLARHYQTPREVQELSVRMNEPHNVNRHPYFHSTRHFNENTSEI